MRITRLRLRNFKPYADAEVSLGRGVTVIHGLNGSGKSSLLEACFFALYGADALDATLDDVVTNGEDETEVELHFSHDDGEYRIDRRVTRSGDRVQTAACTLETPDGSVDGARDVRDAVASLLRMDAEAFVNCAYVRQGEVNKLINATPRARQDMLDDLLQLGQLEAYRERAADARLGVEDVLAERRGELNGIEAQIEEKEDADLHATLNELETELAELDGDIERLEANRDEAQETLEEAEAVIETHEDRREELDAVEERIEELRDAITDAETERESLADEIAEQREAAEAAREAASDEIADTAVDAVDPDAIGARRDEVEAELDAVRDDLEAARLAVQSLEDEAERLTERAEEHDTDAAAAREDADALMDDVDAGEDRLADRRDALSDLEDARDEARARFEDAPVDPGGAEAHRDEIAAALDEAREREAELAADLDAARERVEEAERLLEAGKCPECGQPVEGSPHVDALDDRRDRVEALETDLEAHRERVDALEADLEDAESLAEAARELERLDERLEDHRALVDDLEDSLEEKRDRAADRRDDADEHETAAVAAREDAAAARAEADERREEVAALNGEASTWREERAALDAALEYLDEAAAHDQEIESRRDRREHLAELAEERRERLAEARERRDELAAAVDEDRLEAAVADRDRASAYLEEVEDELASLRDRRDDLRERVGGVRSELDALDALRDRRDDLADRVAALESLYEEADELEAAYGDLRAELRRRNIAALERLLNETFDLVYQNDAYARIELDDDYALTVYQKDGEALEPEQLSGGERALFNLSLRAAIYRLLSEGIEGAAPMPPLILDEPTVFLDAGHVSQLVELVEAMRDLGVEQIVVVSHDEELVGAADDLVTVRKDATTNRSRVAAGERAVPAE